MSGVCRFLVLDVDDVYGLFELELAFDRRLFPGLALAPAFAGAAGGRLYFQLRPGETGDGVEFLHSRDLVRSASPRQLEGVIAFLAASLAVPARRPCFVTLDLGFFAGLASCSASRFLLLGRRARRF